MSVFSLDLKRIGSSIDQRLLVVMPVYNEEANIRVVLAEWTAALKAELDNFAFVIINDGSRDGTEAILQELESNDPEHYIVVTKPNSGHGNSCRVGYDVACASRCEWVLQIDTDGQCDPCYFSAFWTEKDQADCVFGVRKSRDDGWARVVTSQICRWGSSMVCGVDLRDPNVPYRLLRKSVLFGALNFIPPGFNIHNVAITFVLKKTPKLRFRYVPIHFRERQGGKNSINLLNVTQWGVDMLVELWKLQRKIGP
ncbi:MAG: glycosyltransferase family 2 protein [Blastochloris sp.]|nr:glycosyltransferase family 2 protein [Blastochloris sp.]